jgi:peptidase C39-like protein
MYRFAIPIRLSVVAPLRVSVPGLASLLAPAQPLAVPYFHQDQNNWCWAACCKMVFALFGVTVEQCDLATKQFVTDCCANPASSTCDQGEWPENVYPAYGFTITKTMRAFTFAEIRAEIDAGRPVECYYAWTQGHAHVAIIYGYTDNADQDMDVHDPWYDSSTRTYAYVKSAYGMGEWTMTYSDLHN